jgi:hypothetical protein
MTKDEKVAAFKQALQATISTGQHGPYLSPFRIGVVGVIGGQLRVTCGSEGSPVFDIDIRCIDDSDRR